jgi:hypothetical protein
VAPTVSDPAEPVPGVETTLPDHIPPNAVVCFHRPHQRQQDQGFGAGSRGARAHAPAARRLEFDPGHRGRGIDNDRPRRHFGAADHHADGARSRRAFLRYAADLRTAKPGVKVTVAPAQSCGYSSQRLSGAGPGAIDFADRITHIWTNTKAYLVAIHLQGPAGAPSFEAAKSTVMQQFAVVIP